MSIQYSGSGTTNTINVSSSMLNNVVTSINPNNTGTLVTHGVHHHSGYHFGNNTYSTGPYYNPIDNTTLQAIGFTEFLFKLLDIDMDFQRFCEMDEGDKLAFTRQHIIQNVIK